MEEITVFRNGFQDSLNLLDDEEMAFIRGGDSNFVGCGKGYAEGPNGNMTKCKCSYVKVPLPITSTNGNTL